MKIRPIIAACCVLYLTPLESNIAWAEDLPLLKVKPNKRYAESISKARQSILNGMHEQGISGISVAIGIEGGIVWSEGFGYADLETRVPVTPLTKFRIGSVSKVLTAAAVGLLHQEGKLDLDASIHKYVPEFPDKGFTITTRQLSGHLAGIRHYYPNEALNHRQFDDVIESLELFQNDPLLHRPGTRFKYSTYGWVLISAVIQRAADESFLNFMRDHVFLPLGMRNTMANQHRHIIPFRTRFYQKEGEFIVNAPFINQSSKWGGAGFLSTPEDLVRFGLAHLGNGFLDQETRSLLFSPQRTASDEWINRGIGWRIETDAGREIWYHGGGAIGGTSVLYVFPNEKLSYAMCANLSAARFDYRAIPMLFFAHGSQAPAAE